jgi:molecular chaperone HtpG
MDKLNTTIIGKDVIESLTLGMYEDARIIYREYIQNSADQIDKAVKQGILDNIADANIWINIDKNKKQIVIEDNATGISSKEAASILKNIAQSTKQRGVDKGFRGIGRLGGLAYCDKLTFEASYKGEDCKTIIEWDAKQLKYIINNRNAKETASEVIDEITKITTLEEKPEQHYFKVTLDNVSNQSLLDVTDIRDYLSMVAPASIHPRFTLLSKIKEYISGNNIDIDEYNISVNLEELSKAYTTKIYEISGNNKKAIDEIKDIVFFNKYSDDNKLLFWGWFGVWSFLKQIPDENLARGIRLRKGNIQIGDEYCLVKLYHVPEKRWNLYTFGEVHAAHSELIPNARRDYFLENSVLKEFESHLRKTLRELYDTAYFSAKVRSDIRKVESLENFDKEIKDKQAFYDSPDEKIQEEKRRQDLLINAQKAQQRLNSHYEKSKDSEIKSRVFNELIKDKGVLNQESISLVDIINKPDIPDTQELFKKEKVMLTFIDDNTLPRQSKEERKLIKRVFDVVAKCFEYDKPTVENIRQKIIEEFNKVNHK